MRVILLAVVWFGFGFYAQAEDEKPKPPDKPKGEAVEEALKNGHWSMKIDTFPIKLPGVSDIPGETEISSVKDGVVKGKYTYTIAPGEIKGTFEGKIEKDKLKVTFEEKGTVGQKGFGEFKAERDEKGKIVLMKGFWKVHKTDPELRWDLVREEKKPKEKKKDKEKKKSKKSDDE